MFSGAQSWQLKLGKGEQNQLCTHLTNVIQHFRFCPREGNVDRIHGAHKLFQHDDLVDGLLSRVYGIFARRNNQLRNGQFT